MALSGTHPGPKAISIRRDSLIVDLLKNKPFDVGTRIYHVWAGKPRP